MGTVESSLPTLTRRETAVCKPDEDMHVNAVVPVVESTEVPGSGDGMHTVVVVSHAATVQEELVEYIKFTERFAFPLGFNYSSRAAEYSFPKSCFNLHLPSCWARYRFGNKAPGAVSLIYVTDLHLSAARSFDEDAATRIEKMLDDFAEMCTLPWVRKCGIVVLCIGLPKEKLDLKGVFDGTNFSSSEEFVEALEFSFRVRCPKSWSALMFKAISSIIEFDLKTSIRSVNCKLQMEVMDHRVSCESLASRTSVAFSSNKASRSSLRASGEYKVLKQDLLELLQDAERTIESKLMEREVITA